MKKNNKIVLGMFGLTTLVLLILGGSVELLGAPYLNTNNIEYNESISCPYCGSHTISKVGSSLSPDTLQPAEYTYQCMNDARLFIYYTSTNTTKPLEG